MKKTATLLTCLSITLLACNVSAEGHSPRKQKLQVVFLFGQSNMVGVADPITACYLTQPAWVPPRDIVMRKPEILNWQTLYWQGYETFDGPQELKDQLQALYEERRKSRSLWRNRIKGKDWNEAEWGTRPGKKRSEIEAFLDQKGLEEGIYAKMAAIIDNPQNKFTQEMAYQQIINRDKNNAEHIERVREIYLKGTKPEDFEAFEVAINEAGISRKPSGKTDVETQRAQYAALGKQHVNLPIAERTHIAVHGATTGSTGEGIHSFTQGPLSIGYGGGLTNIGPKYAVGITLEHLVDAPILLIKCAWGNTTIRDGWRPGSLDGVETPIEKAEREASNQQETETARIHNREPKLQAPPEKTGKPGWCWTLALPRVRNVLANLGKYHPDYDPDLGYDLAGMVWFQGYSDLKNPAYGEQLAEMIPWFRQQVNAPKLPVVCGTVGVGAYDQLAFSGNVNRGMVQAANSPDLKGTVDVVNTGRYYPLELDLIYSVFESMDKDSPAYKELQHLRSRAISNKTFHYHGSAKFFLLAGDAMGRSLASMMNGGQPTILEAAK